MLVAETGTFAQSVISSDYNGENQTPQNVSSTIQCIFIGYLSGTRCSTRVYELRFLPSRKIKKLGSEISQTYLVLNPDSSN